MKHYHITLIASSATLALGLYLGNGHQDILKTIGYVSGGLIAGVSANSLVANGKIKNLRDEFSKLQTKCAKQNHELQDNRVNLANKCGDLKLSRDTIKRLQETNQQISVQLKDLQIKTQNDERIIKELTVKVERLGQQCIDQEEELTHILHQEKFMLLNYSILIVKA